LHPGQKAIGPAIGHELTAGQAGIAHEQGDGKLVGGGFEGKQIHPGILP
jgi:hypothetical protein